MAEWGKPPPAAPAQLGHGSPASHMKEVVQVLAAQFGTQPSDFREGMENVDI